MKNILTMLTLLLFLQRLTAQKIIEKHFDFSQKNEISMNIEIADSIRVLTWNKKEVYVKASINVNENKNNDDYDVSFNETDHTLIVKSKFIRNSCQDTTSNCHCSCNCRSHIYCDVYIPENASFSIETIDGNISISGKPSEISAHTISGFIDLTIDPKTKADLKMNTISGTMYSDINLLAQDKNLRHVGGTSISTRLNGGGGSSIDLETISGDIFFRKSS